MNTQNTSAATQVAGLSEVAGSQFWPCPHRCNLWARCEPIDLQGRLSPNHHSNCEHFNASLIPVWKVSDGSTHFYTHDEASAKTEAEGCDDIVISRVKMHREVFERLPEFDGF